MWHESLIHWTVLLLIGLGRTAVSWRNGRCLDNTVGRQAFLDHIATGQTFLAVYSIYIDPPVGNPASPPTRFAKPKNEWTLTNDVDTSTLTRLVAVDSCITITTLNSTITDRRQLRRAGPFCRKLDFYITLDKEGESQQRFISQDPSRYFWWFPCLSGTVNSFESCQNGFIALQIPDNRETSDIDLTGLPWSSIEEDFEDFTGVKLDDPRVEYLWIGDECPDENGRY